MTTEILTMLGMTVTILVASWTMIRSLRVDLKADLGQVETRLGNEIKATRTELREDIQAVRDELTGKIESLNAELTGKIESLNAELTGKIESLNDAQHGLNERMAGVEGLVMGLKEAIVARAAA